MNTYKYIVGLLLLSLVVSCSSDIEDVNLDLNKEEMVGEKTVSMNFNCSKADFDVDLKSSTRATASGEWENGDIVYLLFSCDNGSVPGKAVYNSSTKGWTVTYEGTLTRDKELKLQAYYFDGEAVEADGIVSLQPTTGIYRDLEGSYVYPTGDEINAAAHLVPATGRIRFLGKRDNKICVTGLSSFNSLNLSTMSFDTKQVNTKIRFQIDDYTPYIYVTGNISKLCLSNGVYSYTLIEENRVCSPSKSVYMQCPTPSKHNGWNLEDRSNGYDFVDLDLPSGTLWATKNVGAASISEKGNYYSWGECETKSNYSQSTYQWSISNPTSLPLTYDVANKTWGGDWRIPSAEECSELLQECNSSIHTENGITGILLVSKRNGAQVFFPAGGFYDGNSLRYDNVEGEYWTSTVLDWKYYNVKSLDIDINNAYSVIHVLNGDKNIFRGYNVRPVISVEKI